MKIQPLHDRVVVKRLEIETKSPGGILIPDNVAEKPMQGEVIAVGTGKITDSGKVRPVQVKVGQRILFGKYSGTEVELEGEDIVVMREDDVLAILS